MILDRQVAPRLDAIESDEVRALFREHGMVLFRGFAAGPTEFDAFARRFTESYFFGYGRAPFTGLPAITTVNETNLPLEPHCDNGVRPLAQRPDITWFYCENPACAAGETTLFDGVKVWNALSAETQDLLFRQRICFISTYAEAAWSKMGFADAAAFGRFVKSVAGSPRRFLPDGAVEVEVLSSAVRRTRYGDALAFVSSLRLAGAQGFEAMRVVLEDGSEIPTAVMRQVDAALAQCCELVRWQAGDVAMLDNTRFLHGRRGFSDSARRLYLIQTLRANF